MKYLEQHKSIEIESRLVDAQGERRGDRVGSKCFMGTGFYSGVKML